LRRRFEQNQEDCTFTVLALLPTATANIIEAMNTENITYEIQQMRSAPTKSIKSGSGSMSPPSIGDTVATEDDGRSLASLQSESGIHASQISVPPAVSAGGDGAQEGIPPTTPQKKKTKRQLWDDLTISCKPVSSSLLPSVD
jgi:peroxin-3